MPALHPCKLLFLALVVVFADLLAATGEAKRKFDIPAGRAESTLKQFGEQAGIQFFYSTSVVSGARTNRLIGEMTPGDALQAMLNQTQLLAVQDERTGAYTVHKAKSISDVEKNVESRPAL